MLRDLGAGELKYKIRRAECFQVWRKKKWCLYEEMDLQHLSSASEVCGRPSECAGHYKICVYNIAVGVGSIWKVFLVGWHK